MNRPPNSLHTWRQCSTLAVARNFYEESMNIFKPRVDNRGLSDGVTGMQFPSLEYLFAIVYHITGEKYWIARFLTWCIFVAGVIGLYLWVNEWLQSKPIAYYTAVIFLFIPELFFHCINPLPDILALSASIWALYFYQRFNQNRTWKNVLICTFFATLAGLTKIQYLAIGFFMVTIFFISWQTYTYKDILKLTVLGICSVVVPLSWYRHAVYLIRTSGLYDFGIEFRPAKETKLIVEILEKNIISDLPELLLGFSSFVLFVYGLIRIKEVIKQRKYFLPILVWSIALLIYHFVELTQMKYHEYYMLPYTIVLSTIAGWGMYKLSQHTVKGLRYLAYLCFYLVPVVAIIRIYPARWLTDSHLLPDELYYEQSRQILRQSVPDQSLCIVGPDASGAIFFYMLHKKGFAILDCHRAVEEFEKHKSYAQYLYWYEKECVLPEQIRSQLKVVRSVGNFTVYKISSN